MSDDDRLARVALSAVAEPGDPRLAAWSPTSAPRPCIAHLLAERDVAGAAHRPRRPPGRRGSRARPRRRGPAGPPLRDPGRRRVAAQLDDLAAVDAGPGARRGAARAVGARADAPRPARRRRRGGRVALRDDVRRRRRRRDRRRRRSHRPVRSCSRGRLRDRPGRPPGALAAGGPTVAVLACGADRVYPAAHRQLLDHIAAEGAVVSETAPGWCPDPDPLPGAQPADRRPGRRARSSSRPRCAAGRSTPPTGPPGSTGAAGVPGPVTSAPSQGVHQLIRSGAATLVTSGADVLEVVGAAGEHLADAAARPGATSRPAHPAPAAGARRGPGRPSGAARTRSRAQPAVGLIEVRSDPDPARGCGAGRGGRERLAARRAALTREGRRRS